MLEIKTIDQFKDFLKSSSDAPVYLIKHSTRCPVSTYALEQYKSFLESHPGSERHAFLDLIQYRDVSNFIAESTKVQHQSPQVLRFENQQATWHANHSDITLEALRNNL
ncbi:MAG: bacillithiol system redox-active protein YtxJ [Deltaproteobacteria bacterium]|nr:bacillithiol system redox-active protein YtxJ [Deltaproteobacteria bacterium]